MTRIFAAAAIALLAQAAAAQQSLSNPFSTQRGPQSIRQGDEANFLALSGSDRAGPSAYEDRKCLLVKKTRERVCRTPAEWRKIAVRIDAGLPWR